VITHRKVSGGSGPNDGIDYFTRVYDVVESYKKKYLK
jgi:hypothetical protein